MRRTNIGEVRRVKGNGRYRILIYNEEYYLIDIGTSFWTNIFPYLFWIFRNPGYKIDREVALQLTIKSKDKYGQRCKVRFNRFRNSYNIFGYFGSISWTNNYKQPFIFKCSYNDITNRIVNLGFRISNV